MNKKNNIFVSMGERLINGLFKENPTFVLLLGMCPTLAVTTSAKNGLGMGLTTLVVLALSNLIISALRKVIPDKIRIPAFIVIIASFVTMVELLLKAYIPTLFDALGIYIPLIVVNCIILGRAEAYAYHNGILESLFDGIGMGLGFSFALTLIGGFRELLGTGMIFDISVMPDSFVPVNIFVMAPGAFFVLALLTAIQNFIKDIGTRKGKDMSKIQSGCGGDCMNCNIECGDRKEPAAKPAEAPAPEAETKVEAAPVAVAEPEVAPEPEAAPTAEEEAVAEPEAAPVVEAEAETKAEAESVAEAEADPEAKAETESESEPEPDKATEETPAPAAEPATETVTKEKKDLKNKLLFWKKNKSDKAEDSTATPTPEEKVSETAPEETVSEIKPEETAVSDEAAAKPEPEEAVVANTPEEVAEPDEAPAEVKPEETAEPDAAPAEIKPEEAAAPEEAVTEPEITVAESVPEEAAEPDAAPAEIKPEEAAAPEEATAAPEEAVKPEEVTSEVIVVEDESGDLEFFEIEDLKEQALKKKKQKPFKKKSLDKARLMLSKAEETIKEGEDND